MIYLLAITTLLSFGGIPFGAPESEVRKKAEGVLTEQKLADGDRALVASERIANRQAERKWIIRGDKFAEGVLLFHFDGEENDCNELQRVALSSIEANYKISPRLANNDRPSSDFMRSELWTVTLEGGARIEQRMIYVPLTRSCSVSGRYFPPVAGSTAF